MSIETAVYLEDILAILGWLRSKFYTKKAELEASGVIFCRREGRPPAKRICAFPSELWIWVKLKAANDEMI
jgi:hypothetical protein